MRAQGSQVFRARAKINIGLAVKEKRPDGYHEIETVMQQVSLSDYLLLDKAQCPGLELISSDPRLAGSGNLINRVYSELERTIKGALPGTRIKLYKNIPVAAGLAGGSSDAAAALLGLNSYWKLGLSKEELLRIGLKIGSDVPYCLEGGTCLAQGRGEVLTRLRAIPFFWIIIALPAAVQLSTAEVYAEFDSGQTMFPDLSALVAAIGRGSRDGIERWIGAPGVNSLESASLRIRPEIGALKGGLIERGFNPVMSGSGPSLYILERSYKRAVGAVRALELLGAEAFLSWVE